MAGLAGALLIIAVSGACASHQLAANAAFAAAVPPERRWPGQRPGQRRHAGTTAPMVRRRRRGRLVEGGHACCSHRYQRRSLGNLGRRPGDDVASSIKAFGQSAVVLARQTAGVTATRRAWLLLWVAGVVWVFWGLLPLAAQGSSFGVVDGQSGMPGCGLLAPAAHRRSPHCEVYTL